MNRETLFNSNEFSQLSDQDLPIFAREWDGLVLFYAPGYLAAARPQEAGEIRDILTGEIPFGNLTAHYLIDAALSAQDTWNRKHTQQNYKPTCLTLYTSLACNLRCCYCFAEPERNEKIRLTKDFIMKSAREVLVNCQEKGKPFTAVFHGGGEPTLDPVLPELHAELRTLCREGNVSFYSYLATNGIISEKDAAYYAKLFDDIGLSVDGPPDIQNRQRPFRNGKETAQIVERTAGIIRKEKGSLTVRVTVLPDNYRRIPEIAAYCRDILGADEIRMEPAYFQGTDPSMADEFCGGFLKAGKLSYSGSRIREIHGRYCQVFRQVLHLIPADSCSACYAVSSQTEAGRKGLDEPWSRALFSELCREDPACSACFNRFHCSRGCPDFCPADIGKIQDHGSFRCRVNRRLAETELLNLARTDLLENACNYGYAGMKLRGGK